MVPTRTRVTSQATGPDVTDLFGPLLLAILSGDEEAVEDLFSRARSSGVDTAVLVRDLVMPALCEVGRMWACGEVSIAEEHLATALVSRVLARSSGRAGNGRGHAPRIVFACLAGEFHELAVRFLADVARECGWEADSLGANVPRAALVRFVSQRPPAALALSISLAGHIPEAARAISEVRAAAPGVTILVGGCALCEDPERLALTGADAAIRDTVALRDWLRVTWTATDDGTSNGYDRRGLPEAIPSSLRRKVARSR